MNHRKGCKTLKNLGGFHMRIKLYLNPVSVFPWPLAQVLPGVGEHFDGIEVLLRPKADWHWTMEVRRLAKENGLLLQWHEIWSYELNPDPWHNWVGAGLGKISWETRPLHEQLLAGFVEPVVCYPFRHKEISGAEQIDLWLQTCPIKKLNLTYNQLLGVVQEGNFSVVFDTQHVLELFFGVWGVEELGRISTRDLNFGLRYSWRDFSSYVREIHLNNFRPRQGYSG
ncbi:MAG: hypothetical protein ABL899_01360, partial [Nitrospira sp.]